MKMSVKVDVRLVYIVKITEGFKALMELICTVADAKGRSVGHKNVDALEPADLWFQLFKPSSHFLIGILKKSLSGASAASKTTNTDTSVFNDTSVNGDAALGWCLNVLLVMIARYIEQRAWDHSHKKRKIFCR